MLLQESDQRPAEHPDGAAPVHISSDGSISIDLRGTAPIAGSMATTDITCPKCKGMLAVDEVDTSVRAAQMRCPKCFLTFLQRLRAQGNPAGPERLHRWTNPASTSPTAF